MAMPSGLTAMEASDLWRANNASRKSSWERIRGNGVDWSSTNMDNIYSNVVDSISKDRRTDAKRDYVERVMASALNSSDPTVMNNILKQFVKKRSKPVLIEGEDPIKNVMGALNNGDITLNEAEKMVKMIKDASEVRLNLGVLEEMTQLKDDLVLLKQETRREIEMGDL